MRELNLLNSRVDGRYDILKCLGRGSYAEIFTARDNFAPADSAHKIVVLKCLNVFLQDDLDDDLERTLVENFQNEAVALDRVRHPHIISRFGHGTARDLNGLIFHYLILEYLAGGEVMKLCKTQPIPFSQAMNYIEQVCAGLSFAHRQNVIHRDLKPQNLLLTQNRQIVKIADFGVARTSLADSPITRVGTQVYAPPEHSPLTAAAEIAAGSPPVKLTPAADIYSLAKTLYVMLSGESPRRFTNAPITALPERISRQDWAGGILRVLQKATQTEAHLRHQTVGEFWNDLAQIKFATAQPDDTDEMPTQIAGKVFVPMVKKSADYIAEAPQRASFSTSKENYKTPAEQPNPAKIIVPFGEKPSVPQPLNQVPVNQNANQFPPQDVNQFPPPILNLNPSPQPNVYQPPMNAAEQGKFQINQGAITGVPEKKESKFLFRFLAGVLFLCIFAGILFATHNYLRNSGLFPPFASPTQTKVFVKATGANLRSEADRNNESNILGVLAKDAELVIIRETDEWYFVRVVSQQTATSRPLQNGATGWIAKSVVTTR